MDYRRTREANLLVTDRILGPPTLSRAWEPHADRVQVNPPKVMHHLGPVGARAWHGTVNKNNNKFLYNKL
jgi:hypothetical protein